MSRSSKVFSAILFLSVFSASLASAVFAEASEGEKSVTGFFRRLFNYPVKATKETAGMTSNALHNTGEKVIAKSGENTAVILSGEPEKADLGAPIGGALENTGQALSETAQIPVKAAQEDPQ